MWSSNTESAAQIVSDWGASLSSNTVISPDLDLSWCWAESVCRPERKHQANQGAQERARGQCWALSTCCDLYYYYVIFIFGLYMQNVATNQVRLSSLMEAEQEALRGTQHVIADAQSSSTSNWKSVSLFTSLLVPSVCELHTVFRRNKHRPMCVCQWPLNAAAHVHLKLSQSAKLLQKLLRSSLEMFPLIKPSTDSFTRTCSGPTRGLWPYVWHHTLDAFMTPEPWN